MDDFFTNLIDYAAVEEREGMPVGPLTEHAAAGLIYWNNDVMTLAVCRISAELSDTHQELAAFLEHMEMRNLPVIN